ncbi:MULTISPECIES: DNA repair protein RecO [Holospora]|uniref:DNA repair protein RecO n=2 Tax=Holospora TaxID=44747 RepID=A0A061JH55_9PROT|nr:MULTISPECIES: recombination protein O N-terminal domain-containing protein [Holospora]ETZ04538.1 DNA repair protein RecO [Holospora undulata HU1]GAJ46117.1 DNA repair protein RecO [Holospora elegans E1]
MYWSDLGIVLGWKNFGENRRLLTVLTQKYGVYKGIVYGVSQTLFPGWVLNLRWKGACETSLGTWSIDGSVSLGDESSANPLTFTLLTSMCQLCICGIPAQIPCLDIYQAFLTSMTLLPEPRGLRAYVLFEAHILCYLGHQDRQIQCFIQNWQDPKITCVRRQWLYQDNIWKQLGKHWQNWQEIKERAYCKIFENFS